MTDANIKPVRLAKKALHADDARTRKRKAAETRFRLYGIVAIAIGMAFLLFLFGSILRSGLPAFTQTVLDVEITITQDQFDTAEGKLFKTREYEKLFVGALDAQLRQSGLAVAFDAKAIERLVGKPGSTIRAFFAKTQIASEQRSALICPRRRAWMGI